MSTILITGALGFIGAHAWSHFRDMGHHVIAVDREASWTDRTYVLNRAASLGLDVSEAHLGGIGTWTPPAELTAAIHLAGLGGARGGWGAALDRYLDENVLALSILLDRVLDRCPRVLFASSSSVYGAGALPSVEGQTLHPMHPYACSKIAAEELAAMYAMRHPYAEITGLRFFTVYGPGQRTDMAFQRIIEAGKRRSSFELYGDGSQTRSFTYVGDIVTVLEKLVSRAVEPGWRPLNIGNPRPRSLNAAISILQALGMSPSSIERSPAAIEPRGTACDVTELQTRIGTFPWTPLEQGLERHLSGSAGRYTPTALAG